jgi:ribosomal protein L3
VQNLRVVKFLEAEGLLLIKGAVPGPTGGVVRIQHAVKRKIV